MQRADRVEAQREQLIYDPFAQVKPAMHRIRPGANAADEQPFEQHYAGREQDDERRAHERRRRQIPEWMREQINVRQDRHTRNERAQRQARQHERQHQIERDRGGAAHRAAHRRRRRGCRACIIRGPRRRASPRFSGGNSRAARQQRQIFQARAVFHHRVFAQHRSGADETAAANRHRADDQLALLDSAAKQPRRIVHARVVIDGNQVERRQRVRFEMDIPADARAEETINEPK